MKIIKSKSNLTKPLIFSTNIYPKQNNGNQFKTYHEYQKWNRKKSFSNNKDAVSNVVTSIMMLGILLTILAMIFTVYIPIWAKTGEANHMEDIESSFLDLKGTIDQQITDNDGVGSSFNTGFKLGAEGGAILGIGRTTGELEYRTDEFSLIVSNSDDLENIYGRAYGSIRFKSDNVYYTNQKFIYENSAVIIEQEGKSAMRADPHFNIRYDEISNKTSIDLTLIQLTGTSDGISGTDEYSVKSELVQSIGKSNVLTWTESKGFQYGQNLTFNITTQNGPIWKSYFESKLESLPSAIRNETVNLTMTWTTDKNTEQKTYNIILEIDRIYLLDCKKGIVEISIK